MDKYYFNGENVSCFSEFNKNGFRDGKYWIKMYSDEESYMRELDILKIVSSCNGVVKMIQSGTVEVITDTGDSSTYHAIKELYVGSKNIRSYCSKHYSEREIIDIFIQLAQTLAELEETNPNEAIIHNDLKPSNILINDEGCPSIIDFNISKKLAEPVLSIHTHKTDNFCAPEKNTGVVSIKSDIFSFGCILDACMGQNKEGGHNHYSGDLISVRKKCTEESIELRYSSFSEIKNALEKLKLKDTVEKNGKFNVKKKTKDNIMFFILNHISFLTVFFYCCGFFFLSLAIYMILWGPSKPKDYIPNIKEDVQTVIDDIRNH